VHPELFLRASACAAACWRDRCAVLAYSHSLTGKVAFVTGIGSGIGKATAQRLAEAGARVAGLPKKREEAEATCEEIVRAGHEALPLAGDVSVSADLEAAIAQIEKT
jgi:NAD(P)-dependent dehydrogenase (short-subunit alcohol dehydrogenase family)